MSTEENSPATVNDAVVKDVNKPFFPFPFTALDKLIASQRRNYETMARANQLATASITAVLHRQIAIAGYFLEDGANSVRHLLSAGAPQEKVAPQADLMKAAFERNVAALREASDLLTKASADTADLLTQRVSESFTELKGAVAKG